MTPSRQLTLITTLGILSLLYCGTPHATAQTVSVSDTLHVRFRPETTELELSYAANDQQVSSFQDRHRTRTAGMDILAAQIDIYPGASPGDPAPQDSTLHERRANAIYYFLRDSLRLDINRIYIHNDVLPLDTLSSAGEQPWCSILHFELAPAAPASAELVLPVSDPTPPAKSAQFPLITVTTNLLYDAAAIPNLGIEIFLGGLWSLTVDWNFAWWSNTGKNRSWQTYGGYLGARRYFGRLAETRCFSGHYAGLYLDALTYDFELGGTGYQAARLGFGGGLEYGFSLPLNKYLNLDFSLGLGFQDGEYKTYEPRDGHFVWTGTYKRMWVGPTKAQVGLKWNLGKQIREGKR